MKIQNWILIFAVILLASCGSLEDRIKKEDKNKPENKEETKKQPGKDSMDWDNAVQVDTLKKGTPSNVEDIKKTTTPTGTSTEDKKTEDKTVKKSTAKRWYLVGGSFKDFQNAQKLYKQLSGKGFTETEIMDPVNKFNRVIISSFNDEPSARKELKRLRDTRKDNSIWLLEGN